MQSPQTLPKAVQSLPEEDFCGAIQRDWYSVSPREFLKHELWLKLNPYRRCVFAALYLHADTENHRCWPSLKTIAEYAGMSERATRSSLRFLERAGYIKVESRFREGQQTSNLYTLLVWPMEAELWGQVEAIPEISEDKSVTPEPLNEYEAEADAGVPRHQAPGGAAPNAPGTTSTELYPGRTPSNNNIDVQVNDDETESTESDVVVVDAPSEDEKHGIVKEMTDIGIATKVAKRLAESFDEAYIQEKLSLLNASVSVHNKAAWLVSAITGDYQPPIPANHSGNDTGSAPAPDIVAELRERRREHAAEERVAEERVAEERVAEERVAEERVDTRKLMRELFGEDENQQPESKQPESKQPESKQPESQKPQRYPVTTSESVITSEPVTTSELVTTSEPVTTPNTPPTATQPTAPSKNPSKKWSTRQLRKMRDLAERNITDPDKVRAIVGEPEMTVDNG